MKLGTQFAVAVSGTTRELRYVASLMAIIVRDITKFQHIFGLLSTQSATCLFLVFPLNVIMYFTETSGGSLLRSGRILKNCFFLRYNIRYGKLSADDSDVIEAARSAELHNKIITFPQGYDTQVCAPTIYLFSGIGTYLTC